ncbi:MAG TPA: SDR family NAD(P)-dependent oxidoreductase [Gemmatimonadaceae bacterium]|nr:SDR family NAD(P)-dependent oxidoreductase [Gemmatimonadaceae bacterium]
MSTALVTGASRGIGRAIAERLAERYEIIAVARSAKSLDDVARSIEKRGGRCRPIVLDVSDHAAVEKSLGSLDVEVLVNNAGLGIIKPLVDLGVDEWRQQMSVNLDGMFYVTRVVLPRMIARGRGYVVNIGSLAGRNSFVGGTCYSATKHAVIGFSESLMLEVRDAGVRVTVIMPGSVDTDFGGHTAGNASWKLTAGDVAEGVWYAINQPERALVSRVEMRPARVAHK